MCYSNLHLRSFYFVEASVDLVDLMRRDFLRRRLRYALHRTKW